MSRLRILYISYPVLPVSRESCGGAEQVLSAVERLMHQRGHATTVAACAGSQVMGELLATGSPPSEPDQLEQREHQHRTAIVQAILEREREGRPFDLIHDHSGAFWQFATEFDIPVLATLHLPRRLYQAHLFHNSAPNVFFTCVSQPQSQQFADLPNLVGAIENGVDLKSFRPSHCARREHLLWLGRICEEKGAHIAVDVAEAAQLPLVIAGQVYPFSYHQNYYKREIVPRLQKLGSAVTCVPAPTFAQKLQLLQQARAVLIPSTVEETSSLVAMEAMACGTPVIAFRRGALAQIIHDGATGFLVYSAHEMAEAVQKIASIDPKACRRHAEQSYSEDRMADEYERLYQSVLKSYCSRRAFGIVA